MPSKDSAQNAPWACAKVARGRHNLALVCMAVVVQMSLEQVARMLPHFSFSVFLFSSVYNNIFFFAHAN